MSYGGNADATGIQVTFLDQTGAKSVKAVIAYSVPVSRILPNIITKMNLPTTSPDGQPMSYSLDHKEGGRRLAESQTLVEAGVQNGDHLIVFTPKSSPAGPERLPRELRIGSRPRAGTRCRGSPLAMFPMGYESPQIRRLRSDHAAMERLLEESSVIRFKVQGKPAQRYLVEFRGRSLARDLGKVAPRDHHEVEIKLGSAYPRTMPEIRWLSPIYHPNISEIGLVCLGGYGTHWVPSLHLDDLCVMLWDMARFHNYDIRSPYNKEAALWAANQSTYAFPTDARPLRDKRAALGRVETITAADVVDGNGESLANPSPKPAKAREESSTITLLDLDVELRPRQPTPRRTDDEVIFID